MLGTIVVDERVFPVHFITLHDGAFIVHAEGNGPMEFTSDRAYQLRLHDNEGHVVLISNCHQSEIRAKEGDSVVLTFTCRVVEVEDLT